MNEQSFNQIKLLLDSGLTHKIVEQVTNVSKSTIARVSTANTFEDYKAQAERERQRVANKKAKELIDQFEIKPEPPIETDEPKIEATKITVELYERVVVANERQVYQLERIADSLEALETLHANSPTKRTGIFK